MPVKRVIVVALGAFDAVDRIPARHRWTLDYPEDYIFIKAVYEELYPTIPHFTSAEVMDLLRRRPDIHALNANHAGYVWYRDHLDALRHYAPEFSVDVVLADPSSIPDLKEFERAAGMIGAEVVLGKVGASSRRPIHDALRLATAYHDIFGNS